MQIAEHHASALGASHRIIADEEWSAAQARWREVKGVFPRQKGKKCFQAKRKSYVDSHPTHLLSGALKCGTCGGAIALVSGKGSGYREHHDRAIRELRPDLRPMRSCLTPSEQALWQLLRGRALGVTFRRQVVIGRYIADFLAPAARLIVEVDGGYHQRRRVADGRRDRDLNRHRVLRLPAPLVMSQPSQARALVVAALDDE